MKTHAPTHLAPSACRVAADRRAFVLGSTALVATLPFSPLAFASDGAVATEGEPGIVRFLKEQLQLSVEVITETELASPEEAAIRHLREGGFYKNIGRWRVRTDSNDEPLGWLLGGEFVPGGSTGTAKPEDEVSDRRPQLSDYTPDLPVYTVFMTETTLKDHEPVLTPGHWDALARLAPEGDPLALAELLLPVRSKFPTVSIEALQLSSIGVTEYFSAVGEVNIRAAEHYRRLRIKNRSGEVIYDRNTEPGQNGAPENFGEDRI